MGHAAGATAAVSGSASGWGIIVAVLLLIGAGLLGFLLVDWFDVDGLRAEAEEAECINTEDWPDEST
jgi:high-affinity Fe2+/Pb2+ permease